MCVPGGGVVCGREDPSDRRRGETRNAHGRYRDPVRSSPAPAVHVRGRRWRSGLRLPPRPWAPRVWALPWMTVRCPAARVYARRGRRARTVGARAWQRLPGVVRCWPGRAGVVVAESREAALEWLDHVKNWSRARWSTRLRREAALDAPPPRRDPRPHGRPRLTGQRRATLEAGWTEDETPWTTLTVDHGSGAGPPEGEGCTDTAVWEHAGQPPVPRRWVLSRAPQGAVTPPAVWSTHLEQTPAHLLTWGVRRWTRAVTCAAARAPGGRATPRQWPARAMGRTTPGLWRRSSSLTVTAQLLIPPGATGVRSLAWPPPTRPTCADALALVRRHVGEHRACAMSQQDIDMRQIPHPWLERVTEALCYAACVDKVELRGGCDVDRIVVC